jgi:hypothetical protein
MTLTIWYRSLSSSVKKQSLKADLTKAARVIPKSPGAMTITAVKLTYQIAYQLNNSGQFEVLRISLSYFLPSVLYSIF